MMRRCLPLLLILLLGCGEKPHTPSVELANFKIDPDRISVSGVSSGAYMAGQLHLAHSSVFGGLGIVAGGPYYCAMGELSRALGPCMKGGNVGLDALLANAHNAAASGEIDDLANVRDDAVWVFHGTLDAVVAEKSAEQATTFYQQLISADAVTYIHDVETVHGLPTLATGSACGTFAAPFLNACDYDAAGEILNALHGELQQRSSADGSLVEVVQPGFEKASMLPHALLYVPASCEEGAACGIHVALHGCSQSSEFVGESFAAGAGYNEWANSNQLLILYPQVESSKLAPMNPYGCWDWWGYSNTEYATKNGPQIGVIKATLDSLAGFTL